MTRRKNTGCRGCAVEQEINPTARDDDRKLDNARFRYLNTSETSTCNLLVLRVGTTLRENACAKEGANEIRGASKDGDARASSLRPFVPTLIACVNGFKIAGRFTLLVILVNTCRIRERKRTAANYSLAYSRQQLEGR